MNLVLNSSVNLSHVYLSLWIDFFLQENLVNHRCHIHHSLQSNGLRKEKYILKPIILYELIMDLISGIKNSFCIEYVNSISTSSILRRNWGCDNLKDIKLHMTLDKSAQRNLTDRPDLEGNTILSKITTVVLFHFGGRRGIGYWKLHLILQPRIS
jgi:hypothetical protein